MVECCQEENIPILAGKHVDNIQVDKGGRLTVTCQDGSSYTASLVVGADGYKSQVRDILHSEGKGWLHKDPKRFKIIQKASPATGSKLKALQIPPNFTLVNTDNSIIQSVSTTIYVLKGTFNGSRNRISLGMLPMKDANLVRPANRDQCRTFVDYP